VLRRADTQLTEGLSEAIGGPRLVRQTMKIQLNAGDGACFPYHFDSDRAVDSRIVTAILYLNPDWRPLHGGELQLLPCPLAPVELEPLFDRLVLFSSVDMLHRVQPSWATRLFLTLWFYSADSADASAPRIEPEVEALGVLLRPDLRHLFARYAYSREWAVSIEQSHEPSPERQHALDTQKHDVDRIEVALQKKLAAAGFDADALLDAKRSLPLLPEQSTVRYFQPH